MTPTAIAQAVVVVMLVVAVLYLAMYRSSGDSSADGCAWRRYAGSDKDALQMPGLAGQTACYMVMENGQRAYGYTQPLIKNGRVHCVAGYAGGWQHAPDFDYLRRGKQCAPPQLAQSDGASLPNAQQFGATPEPGALGLCAANVAGKMRYGRITAATGGYKCSVAYDTKEYLAAPFVYPAA